MLNWTYVGTVFTSDNRPEWIKEPSGKSATLWGPEVRAIHDKIYFYYTLSSASGKGIGVATADSPEGPFYNKKGVNLLNTAGTWSLAKGNDAFVGPGSPGAIITDDRGNDWLPYHSYVRGQANKLGRVLCIDMIHWNDDTDGWPTLGEGNGPTSRSIAPWFRDNS